MPVTYRPGSTCVSPLSLVTENRWTLLPHDPVQLPTVTMGVNDPSLQRYSAGHRSAAGYPDCLAKLGSERATASERA